MCGFAGVVVGRGRRDGFDPTESLKRMSVRLAHRGPDDHGLSWDGLCGLAHRRLSVIDLTRAGRQPMETSDGQVAVAWNGELYNFRELKVSQALEARGGAFRSRTDTEVVLRMYDRDGIDCLRHFDGMYALAAWDRRKEVLHLARDPFGVKPLFTLEHEGCFWFASEIKALLAVPGYEPGLSCEALHHFLGLNYIPGELTAFEGIRELPPGSWLEVDDGARVRRRGEICQFDAPVTDRPRRMPHLLQQATDRLDRAVRRQLVSDVPVGVMLSGGIDSSALAALCVDIRGDADFDTFSLGFDDPSFDESPAARQVAEFLGTRHHEVRVTPERVADLLPYCLAAIDEPYGDGSAIPTWMLAETAAEHVTVLLSGEGGDELHAGYDTHAAYRVRRWFRRVPGLVRRGVIEPLVNLLPVSHRKLSFEFKAKRFLRGVGRGTPESHCFWREVLSEEAREILYSDPEKFAEFPATERIFRELYDASMADDPLDRLLEIDRCLFLPDDLMVKNDRMTMAHSLEARVPFTDMALVRYLVGIPSAYKFEGRLGKRLLRRGLAGRLPASILARKKVGLEMPYSRWLTDELRELAGDTLLGPTLAATGMFDATAVQRLWDAHQHRVVDHGRALWGLLNFVIWHDLFLGRGNYTDYLPRARPPRGDQVT